jgi:hypothetical protein
MLPLEPLIYVFQSVSHSLTMFVNEFASFLNPLQLYGLGLDFGGLAKIWPDSKPPLYFTRFNFIAVYILLDTPM